MNEIIGIDPGVECGFARTVGGVFTELETLSFWEVIDRLSKHSLMIDGVYIEDPNVNKPVFWKRGVRGNGYMRVAQNIGSNKRDAQLIIEYCRRNNIPCIPVAPLKGAFHKLDGESFNNLTGCKDKTSQHVRDAAMLIFGRKQ